MPNYENDLYDITEKVPEQGQKIIVYLNEIDDFTYAFYKDGKFYINFKELNNIAKWIEVK